MDFDRVKWTQIVAGEAESIDYENFKNSVHDGTCRDQAYMSCWAAMSRAGETSRNENY